MQDKEQLTERLHEKDLQYQDLLRDTKLKHTEELETLRVSFENRLRETEKRYSIRFASLRTELHLRLKSEVSLFYKEKLPIISLHPLDHQSF